MLLSIGMIVKNEEKYLEQCLTALNPILENVDSELIIADTGSTDRTVEIAKKFTDNVFYFEWIKDFAAARNSTLQRAQGEWFMIVDADEIFKDCDDIINFFNSGEYKKYRSGSYIQRNYSRIKEADDTEGADEQALTYSDSNVFRLSVITPSTKFVGIIHELLDPLLTPTKTLGSIADHYGYIDIDIDASQNNSKLKRYHELLLKKLETETNDLSLVYSQLYDCTYLLDKEQAFDYLEKGIVEGKRINSYATAALIAKKVVHLHAENDYEGSLKSCEDFYSLSKSIRPAPMYADTEIAAYKALSLKMLERYTESINAFKQFFDMLKLLKSGRLFDGDAMVTSVKFAADTNVILMIGEMIHTCRIAEKFNTASEYLKTLPIYKYSENQKGVAFLVEEEIKIIEHFDYNDIGGYYKQLDCWFTIDVKQLG